MDLNKEELTIQMAVPKLAEVAHCSYKLAQVYFHPVLMTGEDDLPFLKLQTFRSSILLKTMVKMSLMKKGR